MMNAIAQNNVMIILLISLLVLPWKGWALWLAARRKEKVWFIALLVLNTLAILDIIYIFLVAKRKDTVDIHSVSNVKEKSEK